MNFFATLRETIVPLLADIQTRGKAVRTDFLDQEWPIDAQRRVSKKIMELWGLDPAHCYLAESEHPFTTEFWRGDVRITTHYMPGTSSRTSTASPTRAATRCMS